MCDVCYTQYKIWLKVKTKLGRRRGLNVECMLDKNLSKEEDFLLRLFVHEDMVKSNERFV